MLENKNLKKYIIVFYSYNQSTFFYNRLRKMGCRIELLNTPCELSGGCSQSIEFTEESLEIVKDELQKSNNISIKGIYLIIRKNNIKKYEILI